MKRKLFLILIALCVYLAGCGDEGVILDGLVAPTAPSVEGVVGPVPEEVKKMLWGRGSDTMIADFKEDIIEADANGRNIDIAGDIHSICFRRDQEAYYGKYISADGVVIMGHRHVSDRHFYAARDIVLGMTQKHPELRALLTPSRENRPGATQLDGQHDVTKQPTPSRLFRYVLVHNDMSYASIPELQYVGPEVQFNVAPGLGSFWPSFAWGYVGGYEHSKTILIYSVFAHEFAHMIHLAINILDPTFDDQLRAAYKVARENQAITTTSRGWHEYWAENVEKWFRKTADPKQKWYHDMVLEQDPLLYALMSEWFDLIYLADVETKDY